MRDHTGLLFAKALLSESLSDCEDWFQAVVWFRALLMAEGQTGREEGSELAESILT